MASVSAKHFVDAARIFKRASMFAGNSDMEQMRLHLAAQFAALYRETNAQFDSTRFLLACGAAKRGDVTATVNPAKVATPANDPNKGA